MRVKSCVWRSALADHDMPSPIWQGFKEENGEKVGFNTMVYR